MTEDRELLKKRFIELARRSDGGYFTFTDFLGLSEQSAFAEVRGQLRGVKYVEFGGCEGAERVMIRFGDEEELGFSVPFPIACVKIMPRSEKFAEKLGHRDFLGALMNLGIERDRLGDIVLRDGGALLFAAEELAPFIKDSLTSVRNTDVVCSITAELPEGPLYRTEARRIQLSSERLDAVIAKTFCLSRDDAQALFKRGLVFVGGRLCESVSHAPHSGDVISVRGFGRIIYRGVDGLTRKGKLNVTVEIYV